MRRAGTESGLLGFCRKLSREVLQFADPLRPSLGGKSPLALHSRRRVLQIEPLELRNYLSGASVAAHVDPVWFQEVASGVQSHVGAANWTAEGITAANNQQTDPTGGTSNAYDWIVQFDTQSVAGITNIAQTADLLAGSGIQFQAIAGLGIVGQVLVRSSGAAMNDVAHWLAADKDVAGYEQDAVRQIEKTSNDTSMSQLWGMSKINAYNAWNITTGASGANRVVVAVIDSGVDYNHIDLAANIWTNPNAGRDGFAGDVHGYDFANNDGDPMDDNGHGTHVAGTIGAVGNNSRGVAGVNWAVSIMPLKFMTASGSGYLSDAIRAINYTTMERTQYGVNVRVINASWGGGGYSSALQNAITAAGNAGIMFVAAAGNDGKNNDVNPHYPANYTGANVISVAATNQSDQLASFSCYGATTVDLAAPGVSIYSTLPGNRYGSYSGTSMATPHVAGAAALAWALKPTATIAEIRNALLNGVDKLSSLSGKVASGGRLDVLQTLQILQNSFSTVPVVGSLAPSVNNVAAGTSIDLIATGVTAPKGVEAVYFYQDINNNGVYDANDFNIGGDNQVIGGTARLHFLSTNWAPGTYRFFARTLDKSYQFGNAVTTTITINATGMTSFTISANNVVQGTTVTLAAQGLPTGNAVYREVYFYEDTNNDGVFESTDALVGSAANNNGTAQLSISTAAMTAGTHRYFARALSTLNQFAEPVALTLTVRAAENNQNDSPAAATIAVGAKLSGKLETGRKEGWYQFQAVAGTAYTIRTELVTLRDSMLYLYDRDGKTLLASNDDGDSGLASKIDWVAMKTGTYYFKVSAFDKTLTGDYRVSLVSTGVRSLSNLAAVAPSAGLSTGISRQIGLAVNPTVGGDFFHAANLGNRMATLVASSSVDAALPVSQHDTLTATLDQRENANSDLLLDRHPALRSVLGSMLLEEEAELADPVQSMQLNLDALDALFTRLAEGDIEG